jgi:hypothetical protein
MVDLVEALGSELMVHFTIDARRVRAEGTTSAEEEAVTAAGEGVARVDPDSPVQVGQRATFAIKTDGIQFFDAATGQAIWAALRTGTRQAALDYDGAVTAGPTRSRCPHPRALAPGGARA